MIVYCPDHGGEVRRSIGVVELTSGGFPSFGTRHPRWRDHDSAAWGHPGERSNGDVHLRETTRTHVLGYCRDCPGGERLLPVADLLAAFEEGKKKISL